MSLQITRGIPAFDQPDHYATLGITLDASANDIRKRYYKIAQSLHPDSCGPGTDKQQANLLLSKLVNPAYEELSKEKNRQEYRLILRLVSQRVSLDRAHQNFQYPQAQALLTASDYQALYEASVQELASQQYQKLDEVQQRLGDLSELNLAYLLRQEHQGPLSSTAPAPSPSVAVATAPAPTPNDNPVMTPPAQPSPAQSTAPQVDQFVTQYIRRAEDLIAKNRFNEAIKELRDGLSLDPKNSHCNSLLGNIYLQTNKETMAKVHFSQALKLNPQDPLALKGMDTLKKREQRAKKKAAAAQAPEKSTTTGKKSFLNSLFGGKK